MSDPGGRVVLVETSDLLPGMLPFQAWDALATADVVLVRDPAAHPSAPSLHLAGLDLVALDPTPLDRGDLLLTRPGAPDDRRLAKSLVAAARERGRVVYLLEDDERGLAPALAGMVAEHDIEIELVFLAQLPRGTELLRAVGIMDRLRDPDGGCPWDLEQDHHSLGRYLVEETYELLDAITSEDDADVKEELGDVLLQVLFHARIAAERHAFGVDDVARALTDKLVRRHPHVFTDADGGEDADDVQRSWDRLKADEKGGRGPLDGVPASMPGLALLDALLRRVLRLDMMPGTPEPILEDLRATLDALATTSSVSEVTTDLVGRLIAQAAALARVLGVEADAAARATAARLRREVDAAVASADAGPPATDRHAPWADAAGAPSDAAPAQG
ncbi:MAG: MazG family protein [Actinomycetota bacterium]|nr:MazG family protein [Actinomycetota bacterium]